MLLFSLQLIAASRFEVLILGLDALGTALAYHAYLQRRQIANTVNFLALMLLAIALMFGLEVRFSI